uniref:Odorant receptor n=1 Tax=Aulacocentrum confusum TaxID=2767324 RepID=A0A7G8Z922_9HYME|nr:olfactory receptor 3 [Aulacocentrum confusum]
MENREEFELFGSRISILFYHLKLLNRPGLLSNLQRLVSTCGIFMLLSFNFILIIAGVIDLRHVHDLPSLATRISPLFFNILGGFRWIFGMVNVKDIQKIIDQMQYCHFLCLTLDESDLNYKRYRKKKSDFKKYMSIFSGVCLISFIGGTLKWCLNPVLYDIFYGFYTESKFNSTFLRHLPFAATYPWSIDCTAKYFGTLGSQIVGGLTSALGHSTFEILNVTLLAGSCIHLEYLTETLYQETENTSTVNEFHALKFEKKLKNCIIHHREVLIYLDKTIKMFTYPMFLMCLDTTMVICLEFLEASTMKIDSRVQYIMKLTSMFEYWSVTMADLFVYCYFGTKIKELGLKVSDGLYCCDWLQSITCRNISFETSSKNAIQQMIKVSLVRAQKPIIVTGGLFPILSIEVFRALVGFAMSNALILRRVAESL